MAFYQRKQELSNWNTKKAVIEFGLWLSIWKQRFNFDECSFPNGKYIKQGEQRWHWCNFRALLTIMHMCNTFELSICCAICICRLFRVLIRAFLLLHRFQNMHSTRSLSFHYWMPFNEFVWCMFFLALVCRCICHFEWIALLFCAPIRIQQPNRLHSLKIENRN